jgi:hypothetical protein
MGPTASELDVSCPRCNALSGEPCRERRIKRSHMQRRQAELFAILSGELPPRRERKLWI